MAVRSDAENEYVGRTTSLPSVGAFTICGWAVCDVNRGAWSTLFSLSDGTSSVGIEWALDSSNVPVSWASSSGTAGFGSAVSVGAPFFWFVTWSGTGAGQIKFGYRPSGSAGLTSTTTLQGSFTISDLRLLDGQTGGEWFNGRVYNVKVWDRAVSDDEVLAESFFRRVLFPTSAHAHWKLRDTGDLADYTGGGRTLTASGSIANGEDAGHGLWDAPTFARQLSQPPAPPAPVLTAFQQNVFQSNAFQIYGGVSGAPSHATSGDLTADAATVAGTAVHLTLHTSSGELVAQAATVAGSALHPHTTAGALAAQAATVAGTAAHQHTTTGALTAQAATLSGTAAHEHAATGALTADAATVAGDADHAAGASHDTSGDLVAGAATVAGDAAHLTLHTTSGVLEAQAATVAGTALHPHTTTGALAAQAATLAGQAAHEHAASGALVADAATVSGDAVHTAPGSFATSGDLVAGEATVSGNAERVAVEQPATSFARGFRRKYALWIGGVKYLGTQEDFERLVEQSFAETPEPELPPMRVEFSPKDTRDADFRKQSAALAAQLESTLKEIHRRARQEREYEEDLLLL
jgi:hypothetical protein